MNSYVNERLDRVIDSDANTIELSNHPDLTLDIIKKYPNKAWAFHMFHEHPNFTFEWVEQFREKYWNWNKLSLRASIKDVAKYPHFSWNWSILTNNIHYTEIMKYPNLPWDFHTMHIKKIRIEHVPFLEMFNDKIPEWKWSRLVKCTDWNTFRQTIHLPWIWYAGDVNIVDGDVDAGDTSILEQFEPMFNWIKLTMYVHIDIIDANSNLPWVREFLQWNKTTWKTPVQPIENCIRQWTAANTLKRRWREAISNPEYIVCRKRLQREFKELVTGENTMSTAVSVNFQKLRPDAIIPSKATPGAIGLDLHSVEPYIILPGQRVVVSTGLRVQLPEGVYGRIAPRSGLAVKHGLDVGAGVVDPDYTGELRVVLFNHDSHSPFIVRPGYRIAQLIFERALDQFTVDVIDSEAA